MEGPGNWKPRAPESQFSLSTKACYFPWIHKADRSLGTGALSLRSELLTTLFVAGAHRPRWPPSYEVVHPEEAGHSELISYWTIIQTIK